MKKKKKKIKLDSVMC